MSSVSPSAVPEDAGRRYVPIRCVVEYVEPSGDHGNKGTHSRREQDTVVRLPGHCPFDEIVIAALQKLGYTTKDIAGAKGALQFPNWNSLSCDSITDNLEATVESILGGVASLVTLRIRLHGRPKAANREDVKEKLLSFLLQRLQTVLKNTGCPISQTMLDEISNGHLIDSLPSSTQQAFDRWFRDQLERPFPSNDDANSCPSLGNGLVNCLESNKTPDPPSPRNGKTHPWPTVDPEMRLKDKSSKEAPLPSDDEDHPWSGTELRPKRPVGVTESSDVFEKVPSSHRMRLLPNRNAVYETDAVLPVTPEPPETEVLVITPEMPCGEREADESKTFQTTIPSATYQNEPTDLSVRRQNGSGSGLRGSDDSGTVSGVATETSATQSLMLRPFRVLSAQMGNEYSTKGSRSPSPFLTPPFMQSAAAAAVSGFQSHLAHLQQQQHHAIQLAAMSRALNFHFGPSVHPLKSLTRNDCDRPPFAYKADSLPCTPAPPSSQLTQLGLPDKVTAAMREQKKRSRVFIDPLTEIPKLERWFGEDTHPSSYVIEKFTEELNRSPYRQRFPKLEPKNLQLWFKNHRAKMKRHRDLVPSHPSTAGQGFDAAVRTPSPGSFYSDWADRSYIPGLVAKMAPGHMMMTSSCSPSSSTGSRVASSPAPETKSASDCSDDEMDVCPEDSNSQKEIDD